MRRLGIFMVVLALALIVNVGNAAKGSSYIADGPDHWYCFYLIGAGQQQQFHDQMGGLDDTTDMYEQYSGPCGSATDVVFVPGTQDPDNRGEAYLRILAFWLRRDHL